MKKLFIFVILVSIIIVSCGGEDHFAGKAFRLRAEQGLKEIRNALEGYRINNGSYPEPDNWQSQLKPYFKKERAPEPKWVTKYKMMVMGAKNDISQVQGIMKELKRKVYYADSSLQVKITDYLGPIDSSLTMAEYEVTEAKKYEYRNIKPELEKLYDFVISLNIEEEKSKIINRMEQQRTTLRNQLEGLEEYLLTDTVEADSVIDEKVLNAFFGLLLQAVEKPYLQVKGKIVKGKDTLLLYNEKMKKEIDDLVEVKNKDKDSTVVEQLKKFDRNLTTYTQGIDNIDFLDYLNELRKKLPASINLFTSYYKEREEVLEANRVLNGYAALDNLRSLVKFFEDRNDSIPTGNLQHVFEGEEDMKVIRRDLSTDPYLNITEDGYILEANATNSKQTPISLEVEFINTYNDIVEESFSSNPEYYTNDSLNTFFVTVEAKDKSKTLISTRPKFRKRED